MMEGKMISEVGRGFAAVWASLWCNFQFSRPKPLTPQRRLRTQRRRMQTGTVVAFGGFAAGAEPDVVGFVLLEQGQTGGEHFRAAVEETKAPGFRLFSRDSRGVASGLLDFGLREKRQGREARSAAKNWVEFLRIGSTADVQGRVFAATWRRCFIHRTWAVRFALFL